MQSDDLTRPGGPLYDESMAFSLSIATIRIAQGKANPDDFPMGTPKWQEAQASFMRDSMRLLELGRKRLIPGDGA